MYIDSNLQPKLFAKFPDSPKKCIGWCGRQKKFSVTTGEYNKWQQHQLQSVIHSLLHCLY